MEFELGWSRGPQEAPDEAPPDEAGPVMPEEVMEEICTGSYQRQLIMPNQDGELRVLPVSRARRRSA